MSLAGLADILLMSILAIRHLHVPLFPHFLCHIELCYSRKNKSSNEDGLCCSNWPDLQYCNLLPVWYFIVRFSASKKWLKKGLKSEAETFAIYLSNVWHFSSNITVNAGNFPIFQNEIRRYPECLGSVDVIRNPTLPLTYSNS